jgi:nitroreductase
MTLLTSSRAAETAAPIHDLLAERWSPRSFDTAATIPHQQIASQLEAARWAPSAANLQPRRFVVARRGSDSFRIITDALAEGNRAWAPNASLYVVAIAVTADADGKTYRWAEYDAGQAMAHLTIQAHDLDLHVHPMGGFDAEALRAAFGLPETAVPISVSAIGTLAPAEDLPERFRARESAPRTRLPLDEIVVVDD